MTMHVLLDLPLRIDDYTLEPLSRPVSSDFVRWTTVIRLRGGGEEGLGEDVTYDAQEQQRFQDAGPVHELAGSWTLDSFSRHLEEIEAWPAYRRWGLESAALDLALRQAGLSLAAAVERELRPVQFVVSTRLGDRGTERLRALREHGPELRFKLDPTAEWTEPVVADIVRIGGVATVDFKSAYPGAWGEQPPDPAFYRRIVEALPEAWIEDPKVRDPAIDAVLEPHRGRITWDAVITSGDDVDALPFPPRCLNVKPSRFGPLRALLDFYALCAERGIALYGGGQFELGPGRGQIQYLASLLHPDAPNDVAPGGYNDTELVPGLPLPPLPPRPAPLGFRWAPD
jgi:hypothetical protein